MASLMNSRAAMSRLEVPRATRASTSSSRLLSGSLAGARTWLQQPGRHRRGQRRLAAGGGPHGPQQLAAGAVLEQVAGRAGLDRGHDVAVGVVGGQHQHPGRPGPRSDEPPDRGDAVRAGHPQVHQHHVRPQRRGPGHRLGAVAGLTDDLELGAALEDAAQAVPDDGMVVHDQQPDAVLTRSRVAASSAPRRRPPDLAPPQPAGWPGRWPTSRCPWPGSDSMASVPATTRRTRCRIAVRPKPPPPRASRAPADRAGRGSKPVPSSRTSSDTTSSM